MKGRSSPSFTADSCRADSSLEYSGLPGCRASARKHNAPKTNEDVEYPDGKIPLTNGEGGQAEEVAELVAFLASDCGRFISGTPAWIDGAQSVLVG